MLGVLAVLKEPRIGTLFGGLREVPAVQCIGELMEWLHLRHPHCLPAGFRVAGGGGITTDAGPHEAHRMAPKVRRLWNRSGSSCGVSPVPGLSASVQVTNWLVGLA